MKTRPIQPEASTWAFTKYLSRKPDCRIRWRRKAKKKGEVDFSLGVILDWRFPDPEGLLDTARADLERFFGQNKIPIDNGYPLQFIQKTTSKYEVYCFVVRAEYCQLIAGDIEGMRRVIYFLRDEITRAGGPFLTCKTIRRNPIVKTRISRCSFGPIKRPPLNRDELLDDTDYYPAEYLNRLAHDGVNAIWISSSFKELCPSKFFPEFGKDSEIRLRKLKRVIDSCSRYGIGVYILCMEPQGFGRAAGSFCTHPERYLKQYPELAGHQHGEYTFFCTSTETGIKYLEEATCRLFSQAPKLAGLINITMGEGVTNCYSHLAYDAQGNNCPRCAKQEPCEVFRKFLTAMRRGMRRAKAHSSRLISWLYVPGFHESTGQTRSQFEARIFKIAARTPKDVIFQFNFESMGVHRQLGKPRSVHDYSLAFIGPSDNFIECARKVSVARAEMSAKIQVACSHELATVPYVPVPGNLFRKYKAINSLRVAHVMQSWYFGSYPSLMTKAAGELSFTPFPKSEHLFLESLAKLEWGPMAKTVAKAWEYFGRAYQEFPANINFSWYGPVHDAICWPLYLEPQDTPIAPSWKLGVSPSGDRIGECIGQAHTADEILLLCDRMNTLWNCGLQLLRPLKKKIKGFRDREMDIGVAEAIGLQMKSARNVIQFYCWRDDMFFNHTATPKIRLKQLEKLAAIVKLEITNSSRLALLAKADSRLGFHAEAEGYKYSADLLAWRIRHLHRLLKTEFMEVKETLQAGRAPYPSYIGRRILGKAYECRPILRLRDIDWNTFDAAPCESLHSVENCWQTTWKAAHDANRLYFAITCGIPTRQMNAPKSYRSNLNKDFLILAIEPQRLWPPIEFVVDNTGQFLTKNAPQIPLGGLQIQISHENNAWTAFLSIAFTALMVAKPQRLRINIERTTPDLKHFAWVTGPAWQPRLMFGTRNSKNFGWLLL